MPTILYFRATAANCRLSLRCTRTTLFPNIRSSSYCIQQMQSAIKASYCILALMYISENVSACQNGLTSLARGIFARFFLLLSRLSSSVMKYGTFYSHFVTMTKMNKVTLGQKFIFGSKSQCWGNWDYFIRIQEESSNTVGSSDTILSNEALRDGLFSGDHHEERQAEKTSLALKLRRLALAFGLFKVKTDIAYSRRRRPSFFFLATPITYTISFMNNIQKSILLLSQLPAEKSGGGHELSSILSNQRW